MSPPALAFESLTAAIAGRPVLSGLTAAFPRGALVALCGPNGAGKTTLLRVLAGLHPAVGRLEIDGRPLATLSRSERARAIGYLPQGHQTHWPLPVRDVVALGRFAHGSTDPRRLTPADETAVAAAMQAAGVADLADRPANALSGGEKARVALARVLALGAPLILADEPAASLDPRHQIDVLALLRRTAEAGALVIAVTHDVQQARHFAHRCLVLDAGRLVADGPPREALDAATLARVFRIRAAAAPDPLPWEPAP